LKRVKLKINAKLLYENDADDNNIKIRKMKKGRKGLNICFFPIFQFTLQTTSLAVNIGFISKIKKPGTAQAKVLLYIQFSEIGENTFIRFINQ
jgi:hypothetical protein